MSACDLETSTIRQPKPDFDCCATKKITKIYIYTIHISLCDSEEPLRFYGRIR